MMNVLQSFIFIKIDSSVIEKKTRNTIHAKFLYIGLDNKESTHVALTVPRVFLLSIS